MKKYLQPPALLLAAGLGGYFALLLITLWHQQPPLHDEPYFLANVVLYQEQGLTKDFLVHMKDQAPGPLYQFVHTALLPFTGLDVPGVRLVNVFFLGIIIWLLALLLRRMWDLERGTAWLYALNIMAAPMIWQVSGMALTEIPSLLFAFASVVVLWFSLRAATLPATLLLATGAGILAGLGILGRAPFLVLIPAAGAAMIWYLYSGNRQKVLALLLYSIIALLLCMPVFIIWKGLTPPQQAYIGHGISIWHGILGFSYAALITLIIAPRWFVFNKKVAIGIAGTYLLCLVLNITVLHFAFSPLNKALGRVMPAAFMELYPYLISPLLGTLAIYFMACLIIRQRTFVTTPFNLFLLVTAVLLLCSNFAVTHLFSSRYISQVVPFFIPILWQSDKITYSKIWRYAAGMLLGFLSLETYFNFA